MKRIKTQILSAAEWLAEGKALTPIEALNLFGSMRLSSIIHDLRKYGAIIETETVEGKNGSRYARYVVKGKNISCIKRAMRLLRQCGGRSAV